MATKRTLCAVFLSLALGFQAAGQQPAQTPTQPQTQTQPGTERPQVLAPPLPGAGPAGAGQPAVSAQPGRELPQDTIRPNYVLGPNDQILVRTPQLEEINERPFRIDAEGNINMPLIGRVHAADLTQQELEAELVKRLSVYVRQPQVIINIVQFRSEPVFFVGAFRSPGIYPLQGRRTLVEMLVSVGGLAPNASRHIKVTRRAEYGPIPLPNISEDSAKKTTTVEISLGSLRENVNPAEDIVLQPFDVISVERAELIYVTGEVGKVGGIELGERDSVSLAQALTMSGGFTRDAARGKVRVLRPILNTSKRALIEVDAKRVFKGEDNDFPLLANDVLYVSRSYKRSALVVAGQVLFPIIPYIIFAGTR